MELIDKAKLMNRILNEVGNWGEDYETYQIYKDIKDFVTVEAIPISFIKEKIKSLKPQARWEKKYLDEYETSYANDEIIYLKKLVEDWEKENEID